MAQQPDRTLEAILYRPRGSPFLCKQYNGKKSNILTFEIALGLVRNAPGCTCRASTITSGSLHQRWQTAPLASKWCGFFSPWKCCICCAVCLWSCRQRLFYSCSCPSSCFQQTGMWERIQRIRCKVFSIRRHMLLLPVTHLLIGINKMALARCRMPQLYLQGWLKETAAQNSGVPLATQV